MKKMIPVTLAAFLTMSVAGCSPTAVQKADSSGRKKEAAKPAEKHNPDDGSSYGIDLTSGSIQTMSEEKISQDDMKKFVKDVFGDKTKLTSHDQAYTMTYGDCRDRLGGDANLYTADGDDRDYIWMASEADSTRLLLEFSDEDGDGTYTLVSYGAPELDLNF